MKKHNRPDLDLDHKNSQPLDGNQPPQPLINNDQNIHVSTKPGEHRYRISKRTRP